MANYVDKIVDRFGGIRPMARKIGRPPSTVQSWKERGSIPDISKPHIMSLAKDMQLGLKPVDYLPV